MGFAPFPEEPGYFRFVAIFTWPPEADESARERFRQYYEDFDRFFEGSGIVPEQSQAYSLTGARTVVIIGYTNSDIGLFRFASSIIFNTGIQANFHHAVDVNQLKEVVAPPR